MPMKILKKKKGSEVIETLIVIAIMGALAITAISAIAKEINKKNTSVLDGIDTNLTTATGDASVSDPD